MDLDQAKAEMTERHARLAKGLARLGESVHEFTRGDFSLIGMKRRLRVLTWMAAIALVLSVLNFIGVLFFWRK